MWISQELIDWGIVVCLVGFCWLCWGTYRGRVIPLKRGYKAESLTWLLIAGSLALYAIVSILRGNF